LSAENVELVRSMHPGPDVDLVSVINDDDAVGKWRDALGHLFDPAVQGTIRLPGMAPVTYSGLDGLRTAWRDWLKHWASYRVEIEEVLDGGERVVVVQRCHGRPRAGFPEVTHRLATVWTVRDRHVVSVDFNVPYAEALTSVGLTKSPESAPPPAR
jgi:SnoaL-like domain